jgi:integrase
MDKGLNYWRSFMQVIKTKNGVKYREKVYVDGRPQYSPRFARKTDAKEWKARLMAERQAYLATGKKIERVEQKTMLTPGFKTYATNWIENRVRVRNGRRTYENYASTLKNHLLPFFKNRPLDEVTLHDADRLCRILVDKGHNAKGVNIIFGVLKRIFIEATREGVIDKNPLAYYKDLKERPRPDVFLTEMEIKQILKASLGSHFYPLLVVAVNTGMRKGELAGLCFDRVNFETNLIEITRSRDKNGLDDRLKTATSRRYVPMNTDVRRTLAELKRLSLSDYVFTDSKGKPFAVHHLYRDFKNIQLKAGLTRTVRFHDLRHTFASHFMMKGGNIYDLQKILGHSSLEMTQRYAHLAPDHLVNAINIVSFSSESKITSKQFRANTGPAKVLSLKS